MVLFQPLAKNCSGTEPTPVVDVALPLRETTMVPRKIVRPLTSRAAKGAALMPMPFAFWKITELTIDDELLKTGMKPEMAPVVVTGGSALGMTSGVRAAAAKVFVPARAKAEAGSPPRVSASAAFIAYGTLASRTRGWADSPAIWTASQRASPLAKRSIGMPFERVAPICALKCPAASTATDW